MSHVCGYKQVSSPETDTTLWMPESLVYTSPMPYVCLINMYVNNVIPRTYINRRGVSVSGVSIPSGSRYVRILSIACVCMCVCFLCIRSGFGTSQSGRYNMEMRFPAGLWFSRFALLIYIITPACNRALLPVDVHAIFPMFYLIIDECQ